MNFAITGNIEKLEVLEFIPKALNWLQKHEVSFCVEHNLADKLDLLSESIALLQDGDFSGIDMVLSFGGDGTMLSTARKFARTGIPILGVKIGGMGFLTELTPEEFYPSFEKLLQGNYKIVERMLLEAKIEGEKSSDFYALNDFVLDKGGLSRVIHIKTYINEDFLNTYIGDGLIISTPTGSTAYSLAAGGPILLPAMDAIIINPSNPHSLGARPVVIHGDSEVKIKMEFADQKVVLNADGQVAKEIEPGKTTTIKKADYKIKFVSFEHRSFYDILRAKLNWGEDVRESQKNK